MQAILEQAENSSALRKNEIDQAQSMFDAIRDHADALREQENADRDFVENG